MVNLVVAEPGRTMLITIMSYIPSILGAAVILVVGWLIAKIIEAIIVKMLKALRLDNLSDKAGLTKILAQGDIKLTLSEIVGAIVYWLAILIVVVIALNALNLNTAASLIARLVAYIPDILAALFVLVLGVFLANLVATIVRTSAVNAGFKNAKVISQIANTLLIIIAAVIALEQLGIGRETLRLVVKAILASISLAVALAFGLGCKDMAARTMNEIIDKLKK